ncbi:response regulator receiver protein [Methylobacterium sp. 4-46]|uniref:response regulator n=1 Tax=unclassified Methylobacterium TaxID=2615210 RepID=UPI000152BE9C|nr:MULTISPECIES: response regulator [Methylobacterium]ACA15413.1 response regulator receiver protein [Methylobacterium sp. 4-46]WFT81132.1 response regulator [Methylobacterium nodulans]
MIQPAFAALPPSGLLLPDTVLVVEDEALICEMTAAAFADEGYRVLTAADAEEAGRILQREHVDMLFTDIDLARNTDGVTLARAARHRCPDLPVVYTSGGRHRLAEGEAVADSVFVPKPYYPSDVVALANRILGHS